MWNRQRTEHHETVPGDKRTSLGRTRTRNPRSAWAISREPAHPALVSNSDFLAAQQVNSAAVPDHGAVRAYLLTGLVLCRLCGRRLEAHWVHGRAGYRCRHGRSSAHPNCQPARGVYWAERRIIDQLLYQLIYVGELPLLANAVELLAYLRVGRLAVICGPDSLKLEPMNRRKQVTPTTAVPRGDDSGGG